MKIFFTYSQKLETLSINILYWILCKRVPKEIPEAILK